MLQDGLALEDRFKKSREIIANVPDDIRAKVPGIDDWF